MSGIRSAEGKKDDLNKYGEPACVYERNRCDYEKTMDSFTVLFLFVCVSIYCRSRTDPGSFGTVGSGVCVCPWLSGWGSYDARYQVMPYWGMFGGDLIKYLNGEGFPSYAASVAPEGSAWDRHLVCDADIPWRSYGASGRYDEVEEHPAVYLELLGMIDELAL